MDTVGELRRKGVRHDDQPSPPQRSADVSHGALIGEDVLPEHGSQGEARIGCASLYLAKHPQRLELRQRSNEFLQSHGDTLPGMNVPRAAGYLELDQQR